ncbi:MAG TPA: branched-chain amino acid aminotransferase [Phnomibacter sp.]|nr:branched-chain amino acid aminotransferase [Phnomibacter sp.]
MIDVLEIKTTLAEKSRLSEVDIENVPFGKYFTDHMLVAEFDGKEWSSVEIKPYQPLQIDPSNAALHYGQSIFEGIKAYRLQNGEVAIFRPYDNFHRFNFSALRMQMPEVPEEIFVEGMRQLIALDKDWVPYHDDHSLYIRPFMFACDTAIGVRPSERFTFIIILSPTGPYYPAPMRIYVEEHFTRAAPGGVGQAKTAGNYAAAMYPTARAQKQGYQQVLWTDAIEHRYVQEIGTMNVFFMVDGKALTPSLDEGTILDGITRKSVMAVLEEMGYTVEERRISVDELIDAFNAGLLTEVFGAGTAATISMIKELKYRDLVMHFDTNTWNVAPAVLHQLNNIRYGKVPDTHGWLYVV